ncbi:MAG: hypothetical protein DWQ01_07295 [Planctomycetota bacterium]|nr:MAG: hypothetical protein DWQ01_07295 [Planctomycetota bacterium]
MPGSAALSSATRRWVPTPAMRRYLQARLDTTIPPRTESLARLAGVNRTTVWRWHQRPPFLEWLEHQERAATLGAVSAVHSVLYRKALAGDVRSARLFLRRFDPDWPDGRRGASKEHRGHEDDGKMTLTAAARALVEMGLVVRRPRPGEGEAPPETDAGDCPLCGRCA